VKKVRRRIPGRRLDGNSEKRLRLNSIRMVVCLASIPVVIALKLLFPSGAQTVSDYLTGGLDYKEAFTALGHAISGEEKIIEVIRGISLGAFRTDPKEYVNEATKGNKSTENNSITPNTDLGSSAVEAMSPVDIVDETDLPNRTEIDNGEGSSADGKGGSSPGYENKNNGESPYLEELLLRLPSADYEDESDRDPDDIPENVSYGYYVIEFDYVSPLNGEVTSAFGYRIHPISRKESFHYGVDIGGSLGDPVRAFSSGTVELTGYNYAYGNYMFIRHKDGIITFYGHLSKILAEEGQLVLMGETIAKVGSTGLSTGPHLHFEVHNGDTILDPLHYISPEA
jgi:murein DD-endopeptidase MepM/ murein hydrolase activator NlpD